MSSPDTAAPPIVLTPAQFRAAISAALTALLLGALDQTIVSVSVPTIAKQLGGFEWLAWVISAYLIASTVVTPIYGKFSDVFGRRAIMLWALAIFFVASVGCALAQTLPQLVAARVLQGIGGGGLISMAQSMIADVVPMRERGRFQVYVSSVWAGASVAGPVVGGMLTQYLSWPWIFWINLPICVAAAWLVHRTSLPVARRTGKLRVDWLGIVLLLVGLTSLLIAITRVGQGVPLHDAGNVAGWAIALVTLAWFGRHQTRAAEPIIPIPLLRQRMVVICCTILFSCFFLFIALGVLVPLRLQVVAGAQPGDAALAMLPYTLANPLFAFLCGRWIHRHGSVVPVLRLGSAMVVVAMVALALLPPSQTVATAFTLALLGAGFGSQMPSTLMIMQNSVPQSLLGTATALSAFFRLLGGAVGVAVLSSVVLALLRDTVPADAAAHGVEGLGALLGHAAGGIPAATAAAADTAFRDMLLAGAVFSLINVYCVHKLPDVRLHSNRPVQAKKTG